MSFLQTLTRIFFISVLIISIGTVPNSAFAEEKRYTKKQINSDIDFLVKTLKRIHPNLFKHRKRNEFTAIVKNARANIPEQLDRYSILPVFQTILAAVCDEHTTIQFRVPFAGKGQVDFAKIYEDEKKRAVYLKRQFFKESFIMTADAVYMDNPALTFNRQTLQSINGHSTAEIQKFAREITSVDGCADDNILFTRLLPLDHRILMSSYLGISKSHNMSVKSADDENARNYSGALQNLIDILRFKRRKLSVTTKITLLKKYGINVEIHEFVPDKYSDTHGIVVKSNPDKSLYYIYSYSFLGGKKQTKRTNKLLREMIASKPKHVILDLTNNPGGKLRTASHLLSYFLNRSHTIAKSVRMRNVSSKTPKYFTYSSKEFRKFHKNRKKTFRRVSRKNGQYKVKFRKIAFGNPDYKGNLSVLVSPLTHSAGTVVANVLKRKRQATLIGYLNAGSTKTTCFAPTGYFTLPATQIRVKIPDTCYDRPSNSAQKGKLLNLDIPVNPLGSPASLLNSRILEAALLNLYKVPQ